MNDTDHPVRGLSNDSVRRENLANVLRLVHRSGSTGRSRAELTTRTGLNRSTIAALVSELVALDLVVESEPVVRNKVGRPSPVVRVSPRAVSIAVNPEIDAITIAVVGLGGTVLSRSRHESPENCTASQAAEITASALEPMLAQLAADHRVVGVGVAVPGLVSTHDGVVRLAPHLGWVDEPFAAMLAARIALPVFAANDASVGVLAESTFGVGRGTRDLVYFNGGASGIGGGVIAGGVPLGGAAGFAGELGHTLVTSAGRRCHCGATGCLETEVRREPLLRVTGLTDAEADGLEDALRDSHNPDALAEVRRQLDYLAVALRNVINILNPSLIVLGGFIGALYATDPAYLDARVAEQTLAAARESVRIARAELGANILMVGAAELAFAGILADPATFG